MRLNFIRQRVSTFNNISHIFTAGFLSSTLVSKNMSAPSNSFKYYRSLTGFSNFLKKFYLADFFLLVHSDYLNLLQKHIGDFYRNINLFPQNKQVSFIFNIKEYANLPKRSSCILISSKYRTLNRRIYIIFYNINSRILQFFFSKYTITLSEYQLYLKLTQLRRVYFNIAAYAEQDKA